MMLHTSSMLLRSTNTTLSSSKKPMETLQPSANGASSRNRSVSMGASSRPPRRLVWRLGSPNIRWRLSRVQRRIMRILEVWDNFHRLHTTLKDTGRTKHGHHRNTMFLDKPHARPGNFLMEARPLIFSRLLLQVMISITPHHLTN